MSSTIAQPSVMKSMNGVVTYDDGQGTVISGGTVNTQTLDVVNLNTQNIVAPDPGADSNLYVDDISDVYLANSCSTLHLRTLDLNTFTTEYGQTDFIQSTDGSKAIALFTNADNAILLGSSTSPLISDYTCVNDYELANKGYVDAAVSGGGGSGASLTATQTFTGVNTFDNNTNIGKTDESSTINIYGTVNIGNNTTAPGPDTQIYGDVVTIQGLSSTNLISNKTSFGNAGTPSLASVNIGTTGEVAIDFNTYTDRAYRSARIKATGGTAFDDTGDLTFTAKNITQGASSVMYFNGSDIRLGNPSYTSLIRLRGGFEIGDSLNIPPADGYISGQNIYTSARASMSGSTPLFSVTNYGTLTSSFNVNTSTANTIGVEFNTNPSLLSQITSRIVATGTGLLAGALAFTAGAISFSVTTFSVLANTGITLSSVIASFVNLAATQYIDIDPSSTPPTVKYRSNTSNPSIVTASISGGSASATNAGTITLNSNITTVQSQSGSGSFSIDATTSPIIYLDFKTNVAAPTTNMASIYVNGGTTANTGTMSMTSGVLDFYAPTNRLTNGANLYGDTGDGGGGQFVPIWTGNCMTKVTGASTFLAQNTAWHTFLCIPYSNTTAFTITLSNTGLRDCVPFYIYNAGAATITVTASNTFRLIGPGLTRGGQTNITLVAGDGKMFRFVKNDSAGFMSDATRTYGIYVQ